MKRRGTIDEERKKPETMKMLIKKIAVVACAATLAFSMIPATVQAAGWKQNKNGYLWQENDYSYPKNQWKTIYGKQYHFNSGGLNRYRLPFSLIMPTALYSSSPASRHSLFCKSPAS